MKAHQKGPKELYSKFRDDEVKIGYILDTYEDAKWFMTNRVRKQYGADVAKWPNDVQQELRATFAAGDMFRDIMMAMVKEDKDKAMVKEDVQNEAE
jgi:outer membrane protein assembly factor BamE (lipoprotein component of BamABCDE complex)